MAKKVKDPDQRPTALDSMVTQFLNRLWSRWPAKTQIKNQNREKVEVGTFKNGTPKLVFKYKCQECQGLFDKVEVDHIHPRVPLSGFTTLDDWVSRTFCGVEGLRSLCVDCHSEKSAKEAGVRAAYRKEKKNDKE